MGNNMIIKKIISQKVIGIFFISLTLFLSSCASEPVPTKKIANVETAINRARESNAITYAPLELRLAENKFEEAEALVEQEEYEEATLLLEKALIDAKLAEAKALSKQAKIQSKELRNSIDALRREIERKNETE